jgi:hypothetical protein
VDDGVLRGDAAVERHNPAQRDRAEAVSSRLHGPPPHGTPRKAPRHVAHDSRHCNGGTRPPVRVRARGEAGMSVSVDACAHRRERVCFCVCACACDPAGLQPKARRPRIYATDALLRRLAGSLGADVAGARPVPVQLWKPSAWRSWIMTVSTAQLS